MSKNKYVRQQLAYCS